MVAACTINKIVDNPPASDPFVALRAVVDSLTPFTEMLNGLRKRQDDVDARRASCRQRMKQIVKQLEADADSISDSTHRDTLKLQLSTLEDELLTIDSDNNAVHVDVNDVCQKIDLVLRRGLAAHNTTQPLPDTAPLDQLLLHVFAPLHQLISTSMIIFNNNNNNNNSNNNLFLYQNIIQCLKGNMFEKK